MVMHRIVVGRAIVRTSILVPYGIITVVSAFAWRFALAPDSGFVNPWFNLSNFDFFGQFWSSIVAISLSEIWKTTPFMSLLLLAGLAQVPEELQEAAKVDGATWWQRLWKVTIPNMKAAIMVAVLFRTLDAYRIFDNIFIMTNGAQGTETVSFLAYRQMIARTAVGLGSAVSVLLFLTVVLIAFVFIKIFRTDLSQVRGDRG
jgi:multiple sugar transport system permease protein